MAVCASRNLTLAAERMGISQPALTQAIAKLERQVGVPLFDRTTRPFGITAYGELLLDWARDDERRRADLAHRIEEMRTGSGGTLRVGCGPDWIHEILPVAFARLQGERPDIRIGLTVALNDELRTRLDAGDIGVFFASISDSYFGPAYETRILIRERMLVVARADHPIHAGPPKTLDDLASASWAMTGDETFGRQLIRRVFGQGRTPAPTPSVETNSVRAMINILRTSQHLGFLSQTHCNAYPDIAPVVTETAMPLREGGVTWRRDTPLLPAAQRLVALSEEVIAGLLREA